MGKPLAIDLFCGLGGWAEGFLAEGYDVIGFDIERRPYPGQLVLQDVLTLHGSQFRDAAAIVASPPCQKYSYMAMPWSRAKELARWYRAQEVDDRGPNLRAELAQTRQAELNALFNACFRIQREASEAAGREIPLVVENVKGTQPWVGPARAHFGSFYLWGDINSVGGSIVAGKLQFGNLLRPGKRSMKMGRAPKSPNGTTRRFTNPDEWQEDDIHEYGQKVQIESWSRYGQLDYKPMAFNGTKQEGSGRVWFDNGIAKLPSASPRRKQKSAEIAMIPPPLARHIARVFKPT